MSRLLSCLSPLVVLLATASSTTSAPAPACAVDPTWITQPSLPTEIPGGGENFCEFYQYAWQTFLYLVSPANDGGGARNFESQANYPTLLAGNEDSCSATASTPRLFVRTLKDDDADQDFVIPERIGQAGGGATIYDQHGNVVYYDVRFDRGLCQASRSGNLPAGSTELKLSWRILQPGETGYFTMQAVIDGVSDQPLDLGLVGFHLFRTTAQHPEGVWMTWEHTGNAPDCLQPQATPAAGWSFTSQACAQCLAGSSDGPLGCASCAFNQAQPSTRLTGTPTEVCRVYTDGTGPGDHKAAENLADVDGLNLQLIGAGGLLAKAGAAMAVWQHYPMVGGLWLSDPSQGPDSSNQRGSLQLANATMETTFQGDFTKAGTGVVRTGAVNCFACHQYQPGQTASSGLSHIFDDIHGKPGSVATAGSIRNLREAGQGRGVVADAIEPSADEP